MPAVSQTGHYYMSMGKGFGSGTDFYISGGAANRTLYGAVLTVSAINSGANTITVTSARRSNGTAIALNSTVAGNWVGCYVNISDFTLQSRDDSVFPLLTRVTAANYTGGTIVLTVNNTAQRSVTAFGPCYIGTMMYNVSKSTYLLFWSDTDGNSPNMYGWQLRPATGLYGGPYLANYTPVSADYTFDPAITWTAQPTFLPVDDPYSSVFRAVDQDTGTLVNSVTRYNNSIVVGAGADARGLGTNSLTGRGDTDDIVKGINIVHTGLDTRTDNFGAIPHHGINIVSHNDNRPIVGTTSTERLREAGTGELSFVHRNGNINTTTGDSYARIYDGIGKIAWYTNVGNVLGVTSNEITSGGYPQASIAVRAESDNATSFDLGMYLQYSPTGICSWSGAAANAVRAGRTFLKARGQETTLAGGTVITLRPAPNYGSYPYSYNAAQDHVWARAGYYTLGNATAVTEQTSTNTGSLFQVGTSARANTVGQGNVALGITRTQGTTGNYELLLKAGESALTLYDKNNSANIMTYTASAVTVFGNTNVTFTNGYTTLNTATYINNNAGLTVTTPGVVDPSITMTAGVGNTSAVLKHAATQLPGGTGKSFQIWDTGIETCEFSVANGAIYYNVPLKVLESGAQNPVSLKIGRTFSGNPRTFAWTMPVSQNKLTLVDETANVTLASFESGGGGNSYSGIKLNNNTGVFGDLYVTGSINYDTRTYGEFWGVSGGITPAAADTVYAFPMDTTAYSNGVTTSNGSRINVNRAGSYKIAATINVTSAHNNAASVYVWLRENGSDIGTAYRVTLVKDQTTQILFDRFVQASGTSYYEVMYAVDTTDITFPDQAPQTTPYPRPYVMPFYVTVTPVGA